MIKFAIFTIFFGFFFEINHTPYSQEAKVLEVYDGDTLRLSLSFPFKRLIKARLLYIDAPELHQTCLTQDFKIGEWSKQVLSTLTLNKTLRVKMYGKDIYGRFLVEVFDQDKSVNLSLVERGAVLLYPYSQFQSENTLLMYVEKFKMSYQKSRGIFACTKFVNPKVFRKKWAHKNYRVPD